MPSIVHFKLTNVKMIQVEGANNNLPHATQLIQEAPPLSLPGLPWEACFLRSMTFLRRRDTVRLREAGSCHSIRSISNSRYEAFVLQLFMKETPLQHVRFHRSTHFSQRHGRVHFYLRFCCDNPAVLPFLAMLHKASLKAA
jgi:hypothetical protein